MLLVRSPSISPFCFLVSALKMKRKEFPFLLSVLYHDDNLENTIVVEMVKMTIMNKNLGPLTVV